ncbi:hypothetical protein C0W54_03575 [Photobacterium kishitanii]|uniref:hypothetical protein n=1 Tax=Photobacterium kishitanii TaxID=318456 RepID=UPI000D15FA16|nr:hypothetical protein [Photobacterium kishitanii]PSW63696.1 hypothetical protein C0W54_03575 [Photobacterium kishitanii]
MYILDKIKEENDIVDDLNQIFRSYHFNRVVMRDELIIDDKVVISDSVSSLSDDIINFIWKNHNSKDLYHYTKRDAAENIVSSGLFRLNNIQNRVEEGEVIDFCERHSLNGYLELDEKNEPKYKSIIMPNTFYASFTDVNISDTREKVLWSWFAGQHGVRLKFRVTARNSNFREMYYEENLDNRMSLLSDVFKLINTKYQRSFVLRGISRLSSFYLSGYAEENEFRILHRMWNEDTLEAISYKETDYLEIPINGKETYGFSLELIEVYSDFPLNCPNSYLFSPMNP